MKTLPDNPDMDLLRRQAKDLLAGLRDTDPTTTLAHAQRSLAAQYGFGSWTDLKAEVDRRARTAETAEAELARELAARFGIGEVTGPLRSLAPPDDSGRRWSLTTSRGRFEVRSLDTWWPIVDGETTGRLQEAAAAAGVLLPRPVRSPSGLVIEEVGGRPWWVHEHLPSGPPLAAPVSAAVTSQVGAVLAALHGLRTPVDRISPWHASRLSPTAWSDVVTAARAAGVEWADALAAAVPELEALAAVGLRKPAGEPVLTHNALGPGQCRLTSGGRLVVVAWEHAGGQPPAWELADALSSWCVDPGGAVNEQGARALVAGYAERAGAVPGLGVASFAGSANGILNYLDGLVTTVLEGEAAPGSDTDRSVAHLLTHLPTRTVYERLLETVASVGVGGAA